MQLVIGLGNPGKEYENTRHNAGFMALDFILGGSELVITREREERGAIVKEVRSGGGNVQDSGLQNSDLESSNLRALFVYPQTFMNNSGQAVSEIMRFYKLTPADILVLHDEVDLPLGTIKFTDNSGGAGHNGVQSIIDTLGTQEFRRIRIGIESRESRELLPTDAFVLQKFSEEELRKIPFEAIKIRVMFKMRGTK